MKILFHVGGPEFHPVGEQAKQIIQWLGPRHDCKMLDGIDAFEHLEDCDLFVLMGMHWPDMAADWAGKMVYRPMTAGHQKVFENYIASGKPLLAHHGAVSSYSDWPRFGELVGFAWIWGKTNHSPLQDHTVRVLLTGHPIVAGMKDYSIHDELYYNLQIAPDMNVQTHAVAAWDGQDRSMILTAEGGRIKGAGRVAYLANGHNMQTFACPALKQLWINSVNWLGQKQKS